MSLNIIGLGAIGTLIAAHARRAGITVTAHLPLNRIDNNILQQENHITLKVKTLKTQDSFETKIKIHPLTSEEDPLDLIILTTKAHQVLPVLNSLKPRLNKNTLIALPQNGCLAVQNEILNHPNSFWNTINKSNRPQFILGSITHGAYMMKPFHVCHAGIGDISFGQCQFNPTTTDFTYKPKNSRNSFHIFQEIMSRITSLNCRLDISSSTFLQIVCTKVIINSCINPLTAILGCRNGNLLKSSTCLKLIDSIVKEGCHVLNAQLGNFQKKKNICKEDYFYFFDFYNIFSLSNELYSFLIDIYSFSLLLCKKIAGILRNIHFNTTKYLDRYYK